MKPAVVVVAYNRPHSLQRLLASLAQAVYPPGVPLVITIDRGEDNASVFDVADRFDWRHGPKEIIYHETHLGLIGNVFYGGGLSQTYGAVVLLEDDLVVSPVYYLFAIQALAYYDTDPRIAGIALNALWFNGYTHQPFVPYLDDADVFFLQVAWYQGQAYSRSQWAAFTAWHETNGDALAGDLHELFTTFPSDDWFPLKMSYLIQTGRTYVFPRQSLTTNFGDAGTHFPQSTRFFQVPLQSMQRHFRLHRLDDAVAVYDSFMEMRPDRLNRLTDVLAAYEYEIDLYGTKSRDRLRADYVLTSRRCRRPLLTFGKVMWPMEANVVAAVPGTEIFFGRKADLDFSRLATLSMQQRNHDYFGRGRRLSRKQRLQFWLLRHLRRAIGSIR